MQNAVLLPMFAMVLLTVIVGYIMYRRRVAYIREEGIKPQQLASTHEAKDILRPVQAPAENFINLFEAPVLFYTAVITAYALNYDNWLILSLFSIFVGLRYAHSYVQLTSNIVILRFRLYVLSCFALSFAWIALAVEAFF